MSTLAVVEQVMRETKTPMAVRDIVEVAGDALPSRSKTPDTVVARDLSMDIKRHGDDSRFVRTAPGRYTLRQFVTSGLIQMGDSGNTPQPVRVHISKSPCASQDAIGVLSQALRSDRRGILPATSSTGASSQDVADTAQDDVKSL